MRKALCVFLLLPGLELACSDDTVPGQAVVDQGLADQVIADRSTMDIVIPDGMSPDAPLSACLGGGTKIVPTGAGSCASPYKVDLSSRQVGDVVYVEVAGTAGADEKQFTYPGYSGCKPSSTARDIILGLILPTAGASGVWVSVDASSGADPIATMLEDTSCGQPANACSDKNGIGKEECMLAKKGGTGYFGNKPYAVVSEVVHSKKPLTVRFKMIP